MKGNPYNIRNKRFGITPRLKRRFDWLPTLRGSAGRWWRRALIAVVILLLALAAYHFLKPETSLMSSVEIKRVDNRGMLTVGVRSDMPGFCEDGVGLEAELARLLAEYILPDSDDPLKLVECTSKTVSTKLKDGTVDVALALQTKNSSYSCSYSYYTDPVSLVTLDPDNVNKKPSELIIGYIPDTSAGSLFETYVKSVTSTAERSIIDRLLGRPAATPDPATAVTIESVKYGSYDELLTALLNGRIEAAVMSGAYIRKYFDIHAEEYGFGAYYVCAANIGELNYCVVASKDDPALASVADMLIYKLKEEGTLAELIAKYGL